MMGEDRITKGEFNHLIQPKLSALSKKKLSLIQTGSFSIEEGLGRLFLPALGTITAYSIRVKCSVGLIW